MKYFVSKLSKNLEFQEDDNAGSDIVNPTDVGEELNEDLLDDEEEEEEEDRNWKRRNNEDD